jgi:hypothetical protein
MSISEAQQKRLERQGEGRKENGNTADAGSHCAEHRGETSFVPEDAGQRHACDPPKSAANPIRDQLNQPEYWVLVLVRLVRGQNQLVLIADVVPQS